MPRCEFNKIQINVTNKFYILHQFNKNIFKIANEFGIVENDGSVVPSHRSLKVRFRIFLEFSDSTRWKSEHNFTKKKILSGYT